MHLTARSTPMTTVPRRWRRPLVALAMHLALCGLIATAALIDRNQASVQLHAALDARDLDRALRASQAQAAALERLAITDLLLFALPIFAGSVILPVLATRRRRIGTQRAARPAPAIARSC